ncbi:hypothetical protein GCM10007927_09560 [Sulfitobacter pacificus]|uniref:Uncharacterized protein n=1 Tax=Sulfitobacter pacificus TaxID=1499314 RepID=A0ABQ5VGG0_9RHOB|nr:hypothetical protein GCM10007927_09560 [Sulfitobacter pacificus]
MRIGYAFNRPDKLFAPYKCDRVFVDTPKTDREERRSLFLCLRNGDTLFMLKPGDLGYGKELQQLRKILSDSDVTIEYPPKPVDGRGRPAKFAPTPEEDKLLRVMWKDQTYSQAYVLRKASEQNGVEVKRHQLIYRYGKRTDAK